MFLSMEPKITVKQVKVELRLQHLQLNPVKVGLRAHFQLFTQKLELRLRLLQPTPVEVGLRLLLARIPLPATSPLSNARIPLTAASPLSNAKIPPTAASPLSHLEAPMILLLTSVITSLNITKNNFCQISERYFTELIMT